MLCEIETDGEGAITGVGPATPPYGRCSPGCCPRVVRLQIRTRVSSGAAMLCAAFEDDETPGLFWTDISSEVTFRKWQYGDPDDIEIGSCVRTITNNSGSSAIITGVELDPCDGTGENTTWSPDDCDQHLNDAPTDYVTQDDPIVELSGDSADLDDVVDAAISAMSWGEWSEWSTIAEIDVTIGNYEAGYLELYLAEASLGNNGLTGQGFIASAGKYESELRVVGEYPLSIAVSEGTDITTATVSRYVLQPDVPQAFSVSGPLTSEGWISPKAVLRCACPPQFAAT